MKRISGMITAPLGLVASCSEVRAPAHRPRRPTCRGIAALAAPPRRPDAAAQVHSIVGDLLAPDDMEMAAAAELASVPQVMKLNEIGSLTMVRRRRRRLAARIPVNEIFERHEASLKVVYEYY